MALKTYIGIVTFLGGDDASMIKDYTWILLLEVHLLVFFPPSSFLLKFSCIKNLKSKILNIKYCSAPFSILSPIQVPAASPLPRWIERTTQEL